MHALQVGKPYAPGVTRWPEGSEFNWDANGASLILRFTKPSRQEIEAARIGEAEFALLIEGDVIWLLYTFGSGAIPWSDCPYSWHLVPADRRQCPPLETEESRVGLQVILLNAATGIVQSFRLVTLSPEFTQALLNAVRVQASTSCPDRKDYDRQIAAAYARWPSTEAMLTVCSQRCIGGS